MYREKETERDLLTCSQASQTLFELLFLSPHHNVSERVYVYMYVYTYL